MVEPEPEPEPGSGPEVELAPEKERMPDFLRSHEKATAPASSQSQAHNESRMPDFWRSQDYHDAAPAASPISVAARAGPARYFCVGDVVIFAEESSSRRTRECTGRVVQAPFNEATYARRRRLHANAGSVADAAAPSGVVLRGGSGAGEALSYYKVERVARHIVAGLHHAESGAMAALLAAHAASREGKRERKRKRRPRPRPPAVALLVLADLESPAENRDRKLRHVIGHWLLGHMQGAMRRWRLIVAQAQERERCMHAYCRIQGWWRAALGRRLSLEKSIALEMAQEHARAERARAEAEERARVKVEARVRWLRENGVSRDGVRFFETALEMDAFYEKQLRMCQRLGEALERLAAGLKADAVKTWAYHVKHVLPPKHMDVATLHRDVGGLRELLVRELGGKYGPGVADELGALPALLGEIADKEVQRRGEARTRDDWSRPWRPRVNVNLPGLPALGARMRADGVVEVLDLERFKNLQKYQSGPTDASSWLVKGAYARVLFGGYPAGQAQRTARKVTRRSGAVASVLFAGVDTFVCLLTDEELAARREQHQYGWDFRQEADELCAEIRVELAVSVRACTDAHGFAKERSDRGNKIGYGQTQQDTLDRATLNRLQDLSKASKLLDNFAPKLNHVMFPVARENSQPQTGVLDERLLALCNDLENRLRQKERLFIFSGGGSGRVGVLAGLLLGRLYGLEPHDVMHRVQRYHDTQTRFRGKPAAKVHACPRHVKQREQVLRLLQHTEPCYDSIVAKITDNNEDESKATRIVGPEHFLYPRAKMH